MKADLRLEWFFAAKTLHRFVQLPAKDRAVGNIDEFEERHSA